VTITEPTHSEPVSPTADPSGAPGVPHEDRPRRIARFGRADAVELAVAAAAGIGTSILLCVVMDWRHPLTFILWAVAAAMVVEWVLARDRLGPMAAVDRLVTLAVWCAGLATVAVLVWLLGYVVAKGVKGWNIDFFTKDLSKTGPLDPGGGALHALIGTLEQNAIATAIAVPVGILTAVYLQELKGRAAPVVRFAADSMSGLPSIIAGLLVYTVWVSRFGFSGVAASFALVVVMLPIITRTAEEILRTVSPGLRESSLALGSPEWRTITRVVLPTARTGLVTAALLGVARVIGETAPALLTAFGSAHTNVNPFKGQQADLPLFVYQLLRVPNAAQVQRAWSGALMLIALVLVLFTLARVVSGRGARKRKGSR